ncbi:hypothetical protein ACHAW5_010529 [Stephanodiscus triporus]|uniref:J domain-containing protein n=1 Tax=Stephanodiscus triporus TaxID=2934178 RepID=A0ABD3NYK1_9STRA
MPALLRSALSRMGKNSPSSSPSSPSGRKVMMGGSALCRRSLSIRATQFLDDGDTSDGMINGGSQRRRQQQPTKDDDVELATMDESPVRQKPKSLVNVLVNDDCVGIVVEEEEEEEEEEEPPPSPYPLAVLRSMGSVSDREGEDEERGHNEDNNDTDKGDDEGDKDDEMARAGNEALLLIYGHNVNLYTDVFQLPAHSNFDLESIERSHEDLMEQLTLALGCVSYQREAAIVCGYNGRSALDMDPRTYLEIKCDAIRRAREILLHDESRREYDEMLRRYSSVVEEAGSFGVGKDVRDRIVHVENAADDVIGTPPFGTPPSAGIEQEEGLIKLYPDTKDDDGDEYTYGSHGDYSYDSEDASYFEDVGLKEKENMNAPQQGQQDLSPTDQNEFDSLINDSLDDEDFFSQLSTSKQVLSSPPAIPRLSYPRRSPRQQQSRRRMINDFNHREPDDGKNKREPEKDRDQSDDKDKDDFIFDPFNLMRDGDVYPFLVKDGDTLHIHDDDNLKESVSFVCPLPSREEEVGDDDLVTEITQQVEDAGSTIKTNSSSVFDDIDDDDKDAEKPGPKKKNSKEQLYPQRGLKNKEHNFFSSSLSDDSEEGRNSLEKSSSFGNITPLITPYDTDNENVRLDVDCFGSHEKKHTLEAFREHIFLYDNTSISTMSMEKKNKKTNKSGLKAKVRSLAHSLRVAGRVKGTKDSTNISSEEQSELEEAEVRRLLKIASTFAKMNNASKEKELQVFDKHDDYDDDSCYSGYSSNSHDSDEEEHSKIMQFLRSISKGSEENDEIDCFPAEEDDRHSVRFNVNDEEFEYSSPNGRNAKTHGSRKPEFFPCLDVFFDAACELTDDMIDVVETFLWIPDEERSG